MASELNKIEELKVALNKMLPMRQEFQSKLDKKFRLEFNFNSNHMEGNTLTYAETELLLIFDETKGSHTLREYEEMKSHDVALQLVKEWATNKEKPLTEADIKNLNEVILVKPFWKDAISLNGQSTRRLIKIGDYKEFPNSVQLNNGEIFEYASVIDTPILMGELIDWYRSEEQKKELHPVALAALMHYKFVRIHPFDDGNGRISRLLMNYILFKTNLPPVVIKSNDKRNYLSALNKADTGDLNSFIEYISEQLIWSLEISIKAAKGDSIEDPDDLEKEISVWKKQASLNIVEALHRDDSLVAFIYKNTVKEMLEDFENKVKQFYELFHKVSPNVFRNNSGQAGTKWVTDEINKIGLAPPHLVFNSDTKKSETVPEDTLRNIYFQVNLQGYKYNEKNPFSISPFLKFIFNPYKYEVSYGNMRIEKRYDELLDSEEKSKILADAIKSIFTEIKANSLKGKI